MNHRILIFMAAALVLLSGCTTKIVRDNSVSAKLARSSTPGAIHENGQTILASKPTDAQAQAMIKNMDLQGGKGETSKSSLFTPFQSVRKKKKGKQKGSADAPQLVNQSNAGVPSILVPPKD